MRLRDRPAVALLEALAGLAERLAAKRFERGATFLSRTGVMFPVDPRRAALEERGLKDMDESSRLDAAAKAARATVAQLKRPRQ